MFWARLRQPLTGLIGAVLAVGLVFGTVDYALAVPGRGFIGALPGAQLLDYSRIVGRFIPLTDDFVRKQLHLPSLAGTGAATGQTPGGPGRLIGPTGLASGSDANGGGINVTHAFTNDAFQHAYVVPGVPFTAHTKTKGASRQGGEPTACARSGGTAWYRYNATKSQPLEADTFGTGYADTLGVFEGASLSHLHLVGCNGSTLGNAQVPFPATSGKTYYFQITGRVAQGRLQFHLGPLGRTDLASVTSSGVQANGDSETPFISANGRYLVFESGASNLSAHRDVCSNVPLGTTSCAQIYLRDLLTGTTSLVSYATNGLPAQGLSVAPSVTADGRYVAFLSSAVNLVPQLPRPGSCEGETAQYPLTASRTTLCLHLYRRDMHTGAITIVSQSAAHHVSNGMEFNYSMTDNGNYISFLSDATNLIAGVRVPRCNPAYNVGEITGGGTHCTQTYLWKATTKALSLVSVETTGRTSIGHSTATDVSADGRFVALGTEDPAVQSTYRNLVPGQNMFVRDMKTGQTTLACLSSKEVQPNRACVDFSSYTGHFMSANARYIAFSSLANNLASDSPQTNHTNAYYVRDRHAGTTVRVDIGNSGSPGVGGRSLSVGNVVMSADGRWVAFVSANRDLSAQDTQGHQEIYLHDMTTASTSLASLSSGGTAGNGDSLLPSLTGDGGVLVFESTADNLDGRDATAGQCPADVGGNCSNVYLHQNIGVAT